MNVFSEVTTHLNENANTLANRLVEGVVDKLNIEIPAWEKEMAIDMYTTLLYFFGESLSDTCRKKEEMPEELIQWSKKNAETQVASGGDISEIVVRYQPTREIFNKILTEISMDFQLTIQENSFLLRRMDLLLDVSLNETVRAFEAISIQYKQKTEKEIAALSAPIVPLKDNVIILPLIGEMDEYRADHIMKYVVPEIVNMDTDFVIADFSGILTLNTEVAALLHQIGNMLRIMGVHVITTGLRPDLVQMIVKSGINMDAAHIYGDVKQALEALN